MSGADSGSYAYNGNLKRVKQVMGGATIGSGPGSANEQGFTGHVEDATRLTYMQARWESRTRRRCSGSARQYLGGFVAWPHREGSSNLRKLR